MNWRRSSDSTVFDPSHSVGEIVGPAVSRLAPAVAPGPFAAPVGGPGVLDHPHQRVAGSYYILAAARRFAGDINRTQGRKTRFRGKDHLGGLMNERRKEVLEMLAAGKITADEAERLISALEKGSSNPQTAETSGAPLKATPRYLRVLVDAGPGAGGKTPKVNVRVPMQ